MSEHRIRKKLMGSAFELVVRGMPQQESTELLHKGVEEIERIEALLSEFKPDSITSAINKSAGIQPIRIPDEASALIRRCINLSEITQGAFDITVKPLKSLYHFNNKEFEFPSKSSIRQAIQKSGYRKIRILSDGRIYLPSKGMQLSFASIGKGYAADRVRSMWLDAGVKNGVINASGDISVLGDAGDAPAWRVGIANPQDPEKVLLTLPIRSGSVATSGDYEQYFEHKRQRYAHTINPKTGKPVKGIKSVTVQGISGELCDALATAVTVMGVEVGLHFINQLPHTHCLIVDSENRLHLSEKIKFEDH